MNQSELLFEQACKVIPGGVNSPVRAFAGVGGCPIFFTKGEGAYLWDADNRRYIDYVASWGPMILGHSHPAVVKAIQNTLENGIGFGAPTEIETQLAQKVSAMMPSIELIRMVNSGTEAVMSAIRLARGYTGRDTILKFEGCYHGHSDALLVKAGSGALTLGVPTSLGVPESVAAQTLTLEYNNIEQVRSVLSKVGAEVACIIVEPVAGNMNCILPVEGFLQGLRAVCDEYGIVLIFDEVMTGFRVALGGAQAHYGVRPDLTTLGKIIGGGLPVGAFGGRRDIMECIAPLGGVYQAGTLSGNPLSMSAGLAMLNTISDNPDFYPLLARKTQRLVDGILAAAKDQNIALCANVVGGMFGLFFTEEKSVTNFAQAAACDIERFKKFYHLMLNEGVYLAPSAYETGFMSEAHTAEDIERTITAARQSFAKL